MKLYTGKGDDGSTDLLGARVHKDDQRIDLIGTLDETTCAIGFARALSSESELGETAIAVQRDLYTLMAELAFTDELRPESMRLKRDRGDWLEAETDRLTTKVTLPRHFIVPGDTPAGAAWDVARTVSRRAERLAVAQHRDGQIDNLEVLRYLNRLSSLLFLFARVEDAAAGQKPIKAKSGVRE